MTWLLFIGALWIAPIFFAQRYGKIFGLERGWLWGFFLGWIGFFVVVARSTKRMTTRKGLEKAFGERATTMVDRIVEPLAGERKSCPDCAEQVQAAANVCKHCGHRFEAPPLSAPSNP